MHKILIIDDEENIRETVCEILELKGFEISSASNGKEGIAKAIEFKPDLIICDVMMPKMNGYETIKNVRKIKSLAHTPFVFLSAKTQKDDLRKGMNLGADDYLPKPFEIEELLEVIKKRIDRIENISFKYIKKENELFEVLQEQQKKLDVFSYTNSHKVRGPLARLMGLMNILKMEKEENLKSVSHVLDLMHVTCFELDKIIHDLGDTLSKSK